MGNQFQGPVHSWDKRPCMIVRCPQGQGRRRWMQHCMAHVDSRLGRMNHGQNFRGRCSIPSGGHADGSHPMGEFVGHGCFLGLPATNDFVVLVVPHGGLVFVPGADEIWHIRPRRMGLRRGRWRLVSWSLRERRHGLSQNLA